MIELVITLVLGYMSIGFAVGIVKYNEEGIASFGEFLYYLFLWILEMR